MWPANEEVPISCTSIMKHYMGAEEPVKRPDNQLPGYGYIGSGYTQPSLSDMRKYARKQDSWKPWFKWVMILVFAVYLVFPLVFTMANAPKKRSHFKQDGFPSRLYPLRYWHHHLMYPADYEDGTYCGAMPTQNHFKRHKPTAIFWQRIPLTGGSAYGYAAFYDRRGRSYFKGRVSILVSSEVAPLPTVYCQLWYYRSAVPLVVAAQAIHAWADETEEKSAYDSTEPYILTCDPVMATYGNGTKIATTKRHNLAAVSLVRRPCDKAVNVFNVQNVPLTASIYEELEIEPAERWAAPDKNDSIAVCLKIGDIENDISVQLAEWLQFLRGFGVAKVYIYMLMAHPNVMKVIDYYVHLGFLDVTPLTLMSLPASRTSFPPSAQYKMALKVSLMPNNDCLYRVLDWHRWIIMLDLDEIIIPMAHLTWTKLAQDFQNDGTDALTFDNYYFPPLEQAKRKSFLENEDQHLFGPPGTVMLNYVWRSRFPTDQVWLTKSIVEVQKALACHNHLPIWCRSNTNEIDEEPRKCTFRHINSDVARLYQYRSCGDTCDPNDLTKDDIMLQRYANIGAEVLFDLNMAGVYNVTTSTTPSGIL